MVIETLVFVPLMIFWQWTLIRKAELVRTLHWMLMVTLPTPVLRTLSSKPAKVSALRRQKAGSGNRWEWVGMGWGEMKGEWAAGVHQ